MRTSVHFWRILGLYGHFVLWHECLYLVIPTRGRILTPEQKKLSLFSRLASEVRTPAYSSVPENLMAAVLCAANALCFNKQIVLRGNSMPMSTREPYQGNMRNWLVRRWRRKSSISRVERYRWPDSGGEKSQDRDYSDTSTNLSRAIAGDPTVFVSVAIDEQARVFTHGFRRQGPPRLPGTEAIDLVSTARD